MTTHQAYELRTMPLGARPIAARNGRPQPTLASNAIIPCSGLCRPQSSQFHPGLLSRAQPEPESSLFHKLNSVYTAVGLALTLILTIITYQLTVLSWQLSQWTARKDFLELCVELKQSEFALPENCKIALAEGLAQPPTFMSRRWLEELTQRASSWESSDKRSDYEGIRYQKDAEVWYEDAKDELCEEPSISMTIPELHNVTLDQSEYFGSVPGLGGTSFKFRLIHLATIFLALWVACSAIEYLIAYLRRKREDFRHTNQENNLQDVQQESLSSNLRLSGMIFLKTANTTGISLPQPLSLKRLSASMPAERGLMHWPTQFWSQRSILRGVHGDSDTALTSINDEVGSQPREQKTHSADAPRNKASLRGKKNRHGRKKKSS